MRRWRNQRYSRNRVTGLGDNLIDLEARKLTTLTRFCTLGDLNLNLLSVSEIFCCDTETTGSHLLSLT